MSADSNRQIKYGAIISYAALAINIIAALLYTPWMIHEIGQVNYGLYTLAISFISLFLVDFGIGASLSRFLSKYRAENDAESAKKILGATYSIYFIIDAIILITLAVAYLNIEGIYRELNDDEIGTFKILFLMVGTFNLISFPAQTLSGIMMSYERFIELKICDLLRKLLAIAFVVTALLGHMGIIAVVAANIAAELINIIAKIIIIKRKVPLRATFKGLNKGLYKTIFSFSVWMTVISFAQKFVYNIAPTVLGVVAGAVAIAYYGPASSLGSYYYAVAAAINGLFLPYISRKIADKREEDIQRVMIAMGQFQFLLLGWIFVCFIAVGKMFIVLWLGENFETSYYCTVLVLMPAMFEYAQQIGCTVIIAKNLVKYQGLGFIVISIFTLGLSFVAGKYYGAIGVCASISLAGFMNVKLQSWIFSHKAGLNMHEYNRTAVIPMLIPLVLAAVIGFYICSKITTSWFNMIVMSFVVTALYAAFTLILNRNSRNLYSFILSRIRK